MNYARNQSRWAFSKEQFFNGKPYVHLMLLAFVLQGLILPLFMDARDGMRPLMWFGIIALVGLYVVYLSKKVAYAVVYDEEGLQVQGGYLLPAKRFESSKITHIELLISSGRVVGWLYQNAPGETHEGYQEIKMPGRIQKASLKAPIDFLSVEQWKVFSDETGLSLVIHYAPFDDRYFYHFGGVGHYLMRATGESFGVDMLNDILSFLQKRNELEFLGKTEVHNRGPLNQEDVCHSFLLTRAEGPCNLRVGASEIGVYYESGEFPSIAKEVCHVFNLEMY